MVGLDLALHGNNDHGEMVQWRRVGQMGTQATWIVVVSVGGIRWYPYKAWKRSSKSKTKARRITWDDLDKIVIDARVMELVS